MSGLKTKASVVVASAAVVGAGLVAVPVSPAAAGPSPKGCSLMPSKSGAGVIKVSGKCGGKKVRATEYEGSRLYMNMAGKIGKTKFEAYHYRWFGQKKPLTGKIGKKKVKGDIKTNVSSSGSGMNRVVTIRTAGKFKYAGKSYKYSFINRTDFAPNYTKSSVKRGKKNVAKNSIVRAYISTVVSAEGLSALPG